MLLTTMPNRLGHLSQEERGIGSRALVSWRTLAPSDPGVSFASE
jgi:hypothetical protein